MTGGDVAKPLDAAWDRSRSSRIFALGGAGFLASLAEEVLSEAERSRVLQEPAAGLVMMEAADPVTGASFFVGEVLVTSCQVEVGELVGCAVVMGDEPERARAAAVLDAALQGPGGGRQRLVAALEEERRVQADRGMEWALAARTRVQFETMEDRDAGGKRSGV